MGVVLTALLAILFDRVTEWRAGWALLMLGGGAFAVLSPATEAGGYQIFLIGCFILLALIVYAGIVVFGRGLGDRAGQ